MTDSRSSGSLKQSCRHEAPTKSRVSIEATILDVSIGLAPGECIVVLTGDTQLERALPLYREALRLGAQSVLLLQESPREGNDLGPATEAAFAAADVIVSVLEGSISHARATRTALARGARVVSMGGSTGEMVERLLSTDLEAVSSRSRRIAAALTAAGHARITCPRGTDLTLNLASRSGVADDGDLRAPGCLGNMPFGEGFIAPTGGDGVIAPMSVAGQGLVCDGSILEVRDSVLVGAKGQAGKALYATLDRHGPAGRNVAELGIGAHGGAQISGDILEDEKVLGSVHVAFGANANFGGDVEVPIHIDCVIPDASIEFDGVPFDPFTA